MGHAEAQSIGPIAPIRGVSITALPGGMQRMAADGLSSGGACRTARDRWTAV